MSEAKNPKEVILVNCQGIPETICVETRFITQAAAKQKKNEQMFYITNKNGSFDLTRQEDKISSLKNFRRANQPTTVTVSLQAKPTATTVGVAQQYQPPQKAQTAGTIVPLVTNLNNSSSNSNIFSNSLIGNSLNSAVTMPLSSTLQSQSFNLNTSALPATPFGITNTLKIANISRTFNDQIQQTDESALNMKSIAIQCELDDDLDVEWPTIIQESFLNTESAETEKQNFLKFVEDNSTRHKNFKECLICGEICKSNKYFYGHMAIHQGPKVLCPKCGRNLDHKKLFFQHKCRDAQQLENAFLQCPYHTCSVKAISRLEIYDHINEHANNRMYKCSACRKSFCTGQEFLRHLLIRARCYTTAKRKRFLVYGLESQIDRTCRVRVFALHTFKKRTTLVKTFLSQRVSKYGKCKICLRYFNNKYVYNNHRIKCITKFRKRLIRKICK